MTQETPQEKGQKDWCEPENQEICIKQSLIEMAYE